VHRDLGLSARIRWEAARGHDLVIATALRAEAVRALGTGNEYSAEFVRRLMGRTARHWLLIQLRPSRTGLGNRFDRMRSVALSLHQEVKTRRTQTAVMQSGPLQTFDEMRAVALTTRRYVG
jgi:hypothetical protein